jgi:hypothetical protein
VKRANELVAHCIPNAAVAEIAGAAHFMIATHAREISVLIAQHVAATNIGRRPSYTSDAATGLARQKDGPER